jgi:hypothetical protein
MIWKVDPPVAAVGWAPFVLHVHGAGFGVGSVIVWNGVDAVTTVVSSAELTTTIDLSAAISPMDMPVYVRNTNGDVSNVLQFTLVPRQEALHPISVLTLYFLGGNVGPAMSLELLDAEADTVRAYYSVPWWGRQAL